MATVLERLKSELSGLTLDERAELAHFLIESMDQKADEDAEAALDDELARRAKEIQAGEVQGKIAEHVFAELRERRS